MSDVGPFVGRAAELALAGAELDRARSGEPRVLWVGGPAGIGKTSLVRRLLAGRSDVRTLWAAGDEAEAGLPFGVVGRLVAGESVRGPLLDAGPPTDADPLAVGAELLAALGGEPPAVPVVVVVDDAQWVDDASGRALAFVARRLRRDPVLFVLVAPDDAPRGAWTDRVLGQHHLVCRIALGGLDADEVVALSGAVGGPALTPEAGRRLCDHTGGHPLHTRALLAELPPEALLDTSRILPAPRSLASLVLVRVAKLTRPAQELVLAAAVLGRRCALSDVVALAAVPDPLAALDECVRAGLLQEVLTGTGHEVGFAHELVRAAVYGDLPPAKRHGLHRAAAEVLGGAAGLRHRVAAAVGPDPALAGELTAVARGELDARHFRQAADHLLAAADLSAAPDERARRLIAGVGALLTDGDLARALRVEPDVRAGPDVPGRDHVLGRLETLTGRFGPARGTLAAALARSDGDGGGRAVAAAHLALVSLVEGDAATAAELAGQVLRAGAPPEVAPLARFLRALGLAVQGRRDEAVAELDRPAGGPAAETAGLRGVLAVWADDAAGAVTALSAAARDESTSVQGRIIVLGHLAEAQYRVGDWDGAATNGLLAVSLIRDSGLLLAAGLVNALASHVASGRGEWGTATAQVTAATMAATVVPWWGVRAQAATSRAVLAQARRDPAGMVAALAPYADPAVRGPVDGLGTLPWRALWVEGLLGTGRTDEADAALADLEERVSRGPGGASALEAARLRGELLEQRAAPDGVVRKTFDEALDLAQRVPAELARARLETAYGRHLLGAGERRPAIDLLRAAHDRLERLGAEPFRAVCAELLRAAGLHPPVAHAPLGLTPQELAVARLVAEGRTNREAGAALFVTGRTVAFHLSNIYAKLGVSSRRELAARLAAAPGGRA